jgi:dTMP kinase
MFITFEGGDGVGKSTQARLLAERLAASGRSVRVTREPGGTSMAAAIRALLLHPQESLDVLASAELVPGGESAAMDAILPETELLLVSAARRQHVALIRGWLQRGEIVVSDRYADATYAYQGYGRGLDRQEIDCVQRLATGGLLPDVTFLLDLPAAGGMRRKQDALQRPLFGSLEQTGESAGAVVELNRLDVEDAAFHQRVREGYLARAKEYPDRIVTLDAREPVEVIAQRVWDEVIARLGKQP